MVDECELEEGMDEADKLVSDKRYIFRCLRVVASSVKSCSEGELPSGSSSTFSKFFPALRPTKTMFDTLLREKKHKLSGGEHQEKAQKRTFAGKRQQEDGETRKKPKLGVASSE